MKSKHILSIFLMSLLPTIAFADLNIIVEPDRRWGNADIPSISGLCENVALHFQEQLRYEHKINGKLTIVYNPNNPITFYRNSFGGDPDEYKIGLHVTGTFWAQFSYQFGHEFCHVIQNHDVIMPNNPNDWFHEALCELANLWVMRRMGKTWADRAPFQNWVDWRHNLTNYANNLMNRPEVQYHGTGAAWLQDWEDRMRRDSGAFSYSRVSQLSYKFLPIFEENPEAWNAVRQMPASKVKMSGYMKDWYESVDAEDKRFVEAIAREMGISVATPVFAATFIDADINNDGYVDLADVLIVRNGMQNSVRYDTDVNNDGVTNTVDLLIVKAKALEAIAAAAPAAVTQKRKVKIITWGSIKRR